MTRTAETMLKGVGLVLGTLVVIAGGLGAYVYAVMPRPIGDRPQLQDALFRAPAEKLEVDARLVGRPAVELAAMIREGRATSTAVVRAHLNRIKNENYRTNAFVWLFGHDAMDAARRADDRVARGESLGRLHGVPECEGGVSDPGETAHRQLGTLPRSRRVTHRRSRRRLALRGRHRPRHDERPEHADRRADVRRHLSAGEQSLRRDAHAGRQHGRRCCLGGGGARAPRIGRRHGRQHPHAGRVLWSVRTEDN